jgi:mRNA-degrading endonuclease RelE of RelBE toxin-antitoxin system
MQVRYSKEFQKEYLKQSGKIRKSLIQVIEEVIRVKTLEEIMNCKKLTGLNNIYRIRIGDLRAFFIFHVMVEGSQVYFIALLHRGQAYNKNIMKKLRKPDTIQVSKEKAGKSHLEQNRREKGNK